MRSTPRPSPLQPKEAGGPRPRRPEVWRAENALRRLMRCLLKKSTAPDVHWAEIPTSCPTSGAERVMTRLPFMPIHGSLFSLVEKGGFAFKTNVDVRTATPTKSTRRLPFRWGCMVMACPSSATSPWTFTPSICSRYLGRSGSSSDCTSTFTCADAGAAGDAPWTPSLNSWCGRCEF